MNMSEVSKISRRDFLKLAGGAAAAAAANEAKRRWQNLFRTFTSGDVMAATTGELAGFTLEQLGTEKGELILGASAKIYAEESNQIIQKDHREFDRSELVTSNPNLRPIDEVILEGLKLYEERGGKPKLEPIAIPDPKLSLSDIKNAVREALNRLVENDQDISVEMLTGAVDERIFYLNYFTSNARIFSQKKHYSYEDYVEAYPLGGLLKRLVEKEGLPRED